jgi:hypothetical protein
MVCRETRELLNAFHDGELAGADRSRVEEHLLGCPACRALLGRLAQADRAAGVPDPGPGYWGRFNARVADRIARDAKRERADVLRPKQGWLRQQLRYLVPAAAAAALVVLVVRYGALGPRPPAPAVPPSAGGTAGTGQAGEGAATAQRASPPAGKPGGAAAPRRAPEESGRAEPSSGVGQGRPGAVAGGEEGDSSSDVAPAAPPAPPPAALEAAPAAAVAPSPSPAPVRASPPAASYRDASPPAPEKEGAVSFPRAERGKTAPAGEPVAAPQQAASRAETPPAKAAAKERSDASPCERARTLAARRLWKEAETAQRECLAQDRSAPSQEKGLVFLAELLDRQARFAEADEVILEVHRQFPRSVPLDLYRQQRPMVQRQHSPAPADR